MNEPQKRNFPLTVEKALKLIERLGEAGVPLRISELSNDVGINSSTCYRILQALLARGFVIQDADSSKYRLGYKILEIGSAMLRGTELRAIAHPHLDNLGRETSLTVGLAVRSGWQMVYLDQVHGEGVIRLELRVGSRWPMHCTAAGKAVLAFLNNDELEVFFSMGSLRKFTQNTIVSAKKLLEELSKIRSRRYSFNNAEYQKEVKAIGSPIFGSQGQVLGSIVAAGPSDKIPQNAVASLGIRARTAAESISEAMGFVKG